MIYICIPSRDEERTVGVLLWKIRQVMLDLGRDYQILVLNDGSEDETDRLLARYKRVLPLTVFNEKSPIGYGRAVERLLREATKRASYPKRDAIVLMQADFTESPDDLDPMIKAFEGGADIVAGRVDNQVVDPPRRVRFARWMANKMLGQRPVSEDAGDPLCGFRIYRVVVVKKALRAAGKRRLLSRDGWGANAELLQILTPYARRVKGSPLGLRYDIRWRGSRLKPVRVLREVWSARRVRPLEPEGGEAA